MSFIKFDLKEDFYTKEEIESELEDLNVLIEDLQDRLDGLSLNIDGEGVLRLTTDDNNNVYVGNLYTTKSYVDNKVSEILTRLGVSSSENGVLLLGNKSVIQSGDVATFIVTVYGENNLVVSDEEVTFEFYSSVDDSLLDTIVKTTSFKGIASCTYTGVGRGSVYCKASIQRNNSIIVSEIYGVLDCSWREDGTYTGYGKTSNVSITDGVVANSSSSIGYLAPSLTGSATDTKKWNTDLCIEFDFTKGDGNVQIQLNDGTVNVTRYLTTDCSVRIECKSTGIFFIFDGGTPVSDSALTSNFLFRLVVWAGSSNTIKNLKIYPI